MLGSARGPADVGVAAASDGSLLRVRLMTRRVSALWAQGSRRMAAVASSGVAGIGVDDGCAACGSADGSAVVAAGSAASAAPTLLWPAASEAGARSSDESSSSRITEEPCMSVRVATSVPRPTAAVIWLSAV